MNISLHGAWQLRPRNVDEAALHTNAFIGGKTLSMKLPGDIHSTLLENNVIENPYFGKNELNMQWIGKIDWVLERTITIEKDFISGTQFLTLDFADTFITILINGKQCAQCTNYFRLWRFDVSTLLHEGSNTIQLIFESAERHALAIAKELPYPIPFSVYPVYSAHRNLVRKTQCNAGWDWGPCLMVFGIYGTFELMQTSCGFIEYVTTRINCIDSQKNVWKLHITITCIAMRDEEIEMTSSVANCITTKKYHVQMGKNIIENDVIIENPQLWNPAGYGEAYLYELRVKIDGFERACSKRIGFRTLDVEAQEDTYGKSLTFKVNSRALFAKGSNWIPCDALPSRQTVEKYNYLLDTLVESGQNMVRVWGGGQYEKDCFYDLCDEKGILIWHDFMFACSLYPSSDDFLENVRFEVQHQIQRLKDHPSIALWCGNNEDLGALTWYEESRTNRDRYLIDYDRLNEGVIAKEVAHLDPDRAWWPSSPSAGANDFADCWHTDGRGDMHYWSVWHEKKSFEAYYDITPRFVSEFGYQSFPSLSGVTEYASNSQLNLSSPVMEFHQRCPGGNSIILENFSRYFRFPEGLYNMLYLSQVQQALAIKTAIEYWRSLRPVCMGSIIWQLNDVWPVASWSSIEYSGKWKLLHYAAKQFYAPVALSLYKKEAELFAYCLNDTADTIAATVILEFISFDGHVLKTLSFEKQIESDSATLIYSVPLSDIGFNVDECFVYGTVYTAGTLKNAEPVCDNALFLTFPKDCELQKSPITKTIVQHSEGVFDISLTCDIPSFFVCLDAQDIEGVFSKNLLTLPGKYAECGCTQKIRFTAKPYYNLHQKAETITAQTVAEKLIVTSLRDVYS